MAVWVGDLVNAGYVDHAPPSPADRGPATVYAWSEAELSRFNGYGITVRGHDQADRLRRRARDELTDATLGARYPVLSEQWLTGDERAALGKQILSARDALDAGRWSDALGAAKNLAEAAAKITIARRGRESPGSRAPLSALVKAACDGESDLARRLASVVDALSEARNASDAGHGQVAPSGVTEPEARLAVGAAVTISSYLLSLG